jgi:hypothetical protein
VKLPGSILFRRRLANTVRGAFRQSVFRPPVERGIELALRVDPSLLTVFQGQPGAYGATLPLAGMTAAQSALLDELPSQTTQRERRFLWTFFSTIWEGDRDVVEVGPFLGGTTRAIASGMLHNPRRRPERRLYTFDRFEGYFEAGPLLAMLEPHGVVDDAVRRAIEESTSFRLVFDRLHEKQPYWPLVVVQDRPLPSEPTETEAPNRAFALPEGLEVGAAFVDGCKSWFATKRFMADVAERMDPGGYFLFQDFGWYTCFWLPAFVGLAGDAFALVSYVDHTYTFQLRTRLDRAAVDRFFPDTPGELRPLDFAHVFQALERQARDRSDARAMVSLPLQHAAALAYIGETEEARAMIDALARKSHAKAHLEMIRDARRSPTYRPDGQEILL